MYKCTKRSQGAVADSLSGAMESRSGVVEPGCACLIREASKGSGSTLALLSRGEADKGLDGATDVRNIKIPSLSFQESRVGVSGNALALQLSGSTFNLADKGSELPSLPTCSGCDVSEA